MLRYKLLTPHHLSVEKKFEHLHFIWTVLSVAIFVKKYSSLFFNTNSKMRWFAIFVSLYGLFFRSDRMANTPKSRGMIMYVVNHFLKSFQVGRASLHLKALNNNQQGLIFHHAPHEQMWGTREKMGKTQDFYVIYIIQYPTGPFYLKYIPLT